MWKQMRKNYRRWIASLLTFALVVTNAGGNLGTIFAAGETESALFLLDGGELRDAIQEAKDQGEVFDFSSLRLAAKKKSIKNRYEKLLGKKEGAVYALDLEIDDSYAPEGTELQIFYNAGTDDVIFLFLNESDLVVDYRVNIDGYETEAVRVSPNTMNIEADDEDAASYAENYEAADMIDDEAKKLGAEVIDSTESSVPDDQEDEGEAEIKEDEAERETGDAVTDEPESDSGEGESEEETAETGKSEEESEKSEETGSTDHEEEESKEETDKENEAEVEETETEPEMEAEPETEETEPDKADEDKAEDDADDGELLSISLHEAALVAVSLSDPEDGEEEIAEETEAEESEEETEEESEINEEETEEESEGKTESGDEAGSENTSDKSEEDEIGNADEGKADENETDAEDKDESKADDDEIGSDEESKADEDGIGSDEETESNGSEANADEDNKTASDDSKADEISNSEDGSESDLEADDNIADSEGSGKDDVLDMEGQLLEDDDVEILGELKGKEYDTVTILDHVNAKALKIAWEDIEEIIAEEEEAVSYAVDYQVNYEDAAEIKGADSVEEDEDLYFAVETQEEYELISVTVNGMEAEEVEEAAELASASDWKNYEHVYVVRNVSEDLSVEVEMEEIHVVIPAAVYTAEAEDAVFTVNVPEDAFEEAVEFRAEKISDEDILQDLTSQADEALKEGQEVAGILAYDLAFFTASDVEVEPSKPVSVSISFKEEAVPQEITEDASAISVVHFPEGEEAKTVTTVEETNVEELEFEAESFSTWAAVATREVTIDREGWIPAGNLKELHAAFWPAKTGKQKVYLSNNIETKYDASKPYAEGDHGWKIPAGADYVLDLNGHTLTYGGIGRDKHYLFNVEGKLTIMDSADGGVIDCKENIGSPIYLGGSNAYLNLEGGTITPGKGKTIEHGVYVDSWTSVFDMDGGSIENCGTPSTNGGGIYQEKGVININGGIIKGNTARSGGGIYAVKGQVNVHGGSIEQNTAADGGGIYVAGGFHSINGGEIKGNIVTNNGGGIYVCYGATMVVANQVKITNNESQKKEPTLAEDKDGYYAGSGGGGIYSTGKLTISGGEISNNKARADGGGVYVDFADGHRGEASFTMTDGLVSNNVAQEGEGGGIYFGENGTIHGGSITDNETHTLFDWGGGGIFIQTGVSVKMTNALITDNTADGFGGGVAGCPSGDVKIFTVNGAAIFGNHAKGEGMTHRTEADKKTQDKEALADPIFMKEGRYQDYYCQNKSIVYGKMLGGGSANWVGSSKQKDGQTEEITIDRYESKSASYRMGLSANPDESGRAYAESRASVRITDNKSTTHGAGIMCNGYLELGEKGPGYFEVSKNVLGSQEAREKKWGFTLSLSDSEGNPLVVEQEGSGDIDSGMQQSSIAFALRNEKGELEYGSLTLENGVAKFALKHGQTIIFDDLPAGTIYHVVEDEANASGFTTLVSGSADILAVEDETDATKVIGAEGVIRAAESSSQSQGTSVYQEKSSVDFLNMELSELSVTKKVVGKTDEQSWLFTLTLIGQDGEPLKCLPGTTDSLDSAMQVNTVAFELSTNEEVEKTGGLPIDETTGQVQFMLKDNQTIVFKDIPAGTSYRIVEDGAGDSVFEVKVNGPEGSKEIVDETDSEKVVGIEGTVLAARTATRFINARLGSLAVSKTVIGDDKAKAQEWQFELTLLQKDGTPLKPVTGTEWDLNGEMQNGVLSYEISENGAKAAEGSLALDVNGSAAFVLKHGQTITIKDIPVGSVYKVSETKANQDGYTTNVIGGVNTTAIPDDADAQKVKGAEGEILADQITAASFINTETDILTVSKMANGDDAYKDYEWLFTLELTDENGNPLELAENDLQDLDSEMQAPVIAYKGGSMLADVEALEDGSISLEGGKAQFGLKHGQFITFIGLPVGTTYKITENEANEKGFTMSVEGSEGSTILPDEDKEGRFAGVSGTIEDGKQAKADFVNQKGKLTVRKIVRGNQADMAREFPFTVTLSDKTVNGLRGDMNFTDGVATFKLKNGDSAEARDLPVGIEYSVEEHDNEDYQVESSNASGKVDIEGILVTFINTKNKEETPEKPDRPGNSGGGNPGGPGGRGNTPGGPGTTRNIEEHNVPLANLPGEDLTENIVESDVPLAALPKTGDNRNAGMLLMMFGLAGLGMLLSAVGIKKSKEED